MTVGGVKGGVARELLQWIDPNTWLDSGDAEQDELAGRGSKVRPIRCKWIANCFPLHPFPPPSLPRHHFHHS